MVAGRSTKFEIDSSKFAFLTRLCVEAYLVILLLQLDAFSTLYAPNVESKGAAAYEASAIGSKEVAVELSERVHRDTQEAT